MSYLVLARKWRPQVFEDVVGQRSITQTLQNAISQKRIAHAFLFTGARGVGKTSTARILAKALNCEGGPRINPCNQCSACHEISAGTSMDVIEIDGASNRGIDEIRELRDNVRYTPVRNRYKIYIIDEVHMLTREAFNALLKTLEEPPSHIIFVFATTEPQKIPATILSRCQRYDFKRIPFKEIIGNLKRIVDEEKVNISEKGLLYLAQESEGSMRDAQSLLDQVISFGGKEIRDEDIAEVLGLIDRKILHDTIEAVAGRDAGRCMEIVEHVYHYGYDLQHFCRELLQYLRNLILVKVSKHPEGLMELPDEELAILKKQAEGFQFDQLSHLFNLLLKGEEEIAQSTFPRTMLEMTLIRMTTLRSVVPIDEILKKLEALEKMTPSGAPDELPKIPFSARTVRPFQAQPGKERAEEKPPKVRVEIARTEAVQTEIPKKTDLPKEDLSGRPNEPPRDSDEPPEESPDEPDAMDESNEPDEETDSMAIGSAFGQPLRPEGEIQQGSEEIWMRLVDSTRARNPILGAFLAFGTLVRASDDQIEIGFEKGSFHYDRIMEKENQSQLESIFGEYFKRKVKLVISPLDPASKSKGRAAAEGGASASGNTEKTSENGTEEKALVQEALRLFDGKIIGK
jgi:DNA polymerase III subunit gamma/tau